MKSEKIEKIINIIDLEFDVLFYNLLIPCSKTDIICDNIRKKLESL